jgi:hypothetical protein
MTMRRILAVITVAVLTATATPAIASVNVGSDLHVQYDGCIAKFTAAGMRDLVDQLDNSGHEFVIRMSDGTISNPDSQNNARNGTGTGGTTKWNPSGGSKFADGVAEDTCATLYHEMSHLADYDKGTNRRDTCTYTKDGKTFDTGIRAGEVKATRKENTYRKKVGLPERTSYGPGTHLPPPGTECDPPPPDRPSGGCNAGCAIGAGDPHIKTFDGHRYGFQVVGEFVLAKATSGDPFEIQGRATALGGLRTVSLFSAVAANVGGDRIGIYRLRGGLKIHIGGTATDAVVGPVKLPKGGSVENFGATSAEVHWPDGSVLWAQAVGNASIRLSLTPGAARGGKVEGIFGNFDGKPEGDLVIRGGKAIGEKPSFETLYREFGNSWRVEQAQSLFDYGPGESTETFTDRTFPDREVTSASLPNRASAEAICRQAGVSEPIALDDCILDVGLTGEVAFAHDAATTQRLDQTAGATTLSITQPGGTARLTFPGTAGQKVYIQVPVSTLPSECGLLRLSGPDGKLLNSGCIINNRGYVDTTVLPVNGDYALSLEPSKAVGQAFARVVQVRDQELTGAPNGSFATSTIAMPGGVTKLKFAGTAGQKVFLNVPSSTLTSECGVLELRNAANALLNSGCVINGRGYIDTFALPANGEYYVQIDPGEDRIGVSEMVLYTVIDQSGTITVNGPSVTATTTQPGAVARFTFSGTAGQRVSLDVAGSTLPHECSPLELRDPAGKRLTTGCVINGKGSITSTVLPVTGQYTIVVDPGEQRIGVSQLSLKSP